MMMIIIIIIIIIIITIINQGSATDTHTHTHTSKRYFQAIEHAMRCFIWYRTLCWLRRHNVSRCLGQYNSIERITSPSAVKAGSSDREDSVALTDDEVRLSVSGGAGWRRKQRALRRQASTVASISAPSPDEIGGQSTVEQSFVYTYIYIYIYICVCVCVCVCVCRY